MIPKFKTKVIKGELLMIAPLKEYIKTLPEDVEVVIKPYKEKRSTNQNNYYWSVLKLLSDEIGYTREEMHDILKSQFLTGFLMLQTKSGVKEFVTTKSTANINTKEFEEYLSEVREWASMELGIFVPLPNEISLED